MASIHVPHVPHWWATSVAWRRVAGWVLAVALGALVAAALVLGASQLVENLDDTGTGATRPTGPEVVIRPGNGPSVAATASGRIVSLDCTMSGPVHATADGTGAFTVLSGAANVHCPDGRVRNGHTLRWPATNQVATEPPEG